METKLYNQSGVEVGTADLPDGVFGLPINADLLHQARVAALAGRRRPTAHTKDRSEVRGGGRKPWRQKGTGRARHGSRRSPIWKGGGVTHGPRSDKNYSKRINKKMGAMALRTALSVKFSQGQVKVVDDFSVETPKTKEFWGILRGIAGGALQGALLVLPKPDKNILWSAANLRGVKVTTVAGLDILDALRFRTIIFTAAAVGKLK